MPAMNQAMYQALEIQRAHSLVRTIDIYVQKCSMMNAVIERCAKQLKGWRKFAESIIELGFEG